MTKETNFLILSSESKSEIEWLDNIELKKSKYEEKHSWFDIIDNNIDDKIFMDNIIDYIEQNFDNIEYIFFIQKIINWNPSSH